MSYEKIVGRMPIWFLFFIASSGAFLILCCPFDLLSLNFQNGIQLPSWETIWVTIVRLNEGVFTPFVMAQYLGSDFPSGLAKVVLAGLVVGTFVFLLYDAYGKVNGKIFRGFIRKRLNITTLNPDVDVKEFVEWLEKVNLAGVFDFYGSLKSVTEGLLYGAETFLLINFLRIVVLGIGCWTKTTESFPLESVLDWLGISIGFVLASYCLYAIYLKTFNRIYGNLLNDFEEHMVKAIYAFGIS